MFCDRIYIYGFYDIRRCGSAPARFQARAIILVIAIAGHGILSKYIYAHPPDGVSSEQAKLGGMLMYYGGDAIDLILVFWLCMQWYKAARPRSRIHRPSLGLIAVYRIVLGVTRLLRRC